MKTQEKLHCNMSGRLFRWRPKYQRGMITQTGTMARTSTIEQWEAVYPCWCGITHRGDYAFEDWAHHNCEHNEALHQAVPDDPSYLICPLCGQTFTVKNAGDA